MYVGSLIETVRIKQDPFISSFLNEDYDYCIALLDTQLCLMEAGEDTGTNEPDKITKFLQWLKQNAWQKPRAWFAKMLTKLNTFAAKIAHKEETDPRQRSLWSKVKAAISKAIVWITNKIEQFVRPDKIGDKTNKNRTSMNLKDLNDDISFGNYQIQSSPANKRMGTYIWRNYVFGAQHGDIKKQKRLKKYYAHH